MKSSLNSVSTCLKVVDTRRPGDQLHPDSIAPGDIFKEGKHYFVNIRPDCDCIDRSKADQDSVQLYLLEGSKLSSGQIHFDSEYGEIRERDTETIIFPIDNGANISFKFKNLRIRNWGEVKGKRIGRLLAPFLTRLQQRYSGYLQRPGLTRVPEAALTPPTNGEGNLTAEDRPPNNSTVAPGNTRSRSVNMWTATKSWVWHTWQRFTRHK